MADQDTQTTAGTAGSATTTGGAAAVVVDKNKSNEQYIQEAELSYIVPNLIREKFPDLIRLIFETESMNTEEREYWLQIMPIMSEDQIVKFREILVNEKEQLSKLDQEYQQGTKAPVKEIDEEAKRRQLQEIAEREKAAEAGEEADQAALLDSLNTL